MGTMPQSRTLPGLVDEMASRFPDRDFIAYRGEHVTYSEFRRRVRQLAAGLHALGVRKGDKVALLMGNQTEWLVVTFAAATLGATLVALNSWWRHRELEYALSLSDANVLVLCDKYGDSDYIAALEQIGDRREKLPKLRHVISLSASGASYENTLRYDDVLTLGGDRSELERYLADNGVAPKDLAFLLFTSGSTARPKGVLNEHWGVIENPFAIGERMRLTERDRVLVSISLFWGFGIANAVFAIMTHGACIVLQHRFNAQEALLIMEREKCTGLYATPNMALALFHHPDRTKRDLSSLRTGLSMPSTVPHLIEMGASEICSFYGLTEAYGNSVVSETTDPVDIRSTSCGRALPRTSVVIADPVSNEPLPTGSTGQIKVRGFVMPCYYKEPGLTAEAMDADGYLLTGDLGMLDAAGNLYFRGRLKEMIKSGGINVSPAEVEETLRNHDSVEQAVVVGVPDEVYDEVLAAAIVFKPGRECSGETLKSFCKAQMATYKVPKYVFHFDHSAIPLTDTGKIDKRSLQSALAAKIATQ